ncbi:MAG: IclR family transcriptional regulator [Chloroflexota bacterium]|nr:IclR family transcriptional regulator [Chloroflexota bacterium]
MQADRPAAKRSSDERGPVQSFDRAVAILDAFTADRPELGVSEIARRTGLSRSTAHRLLSSLQHHELVQQVPGSRDYALGPRVLRLAQAALAGANLPAMARPAMTRLRDQHDETVGLHLPQGGFGRIVVDQVESRQPLRRTYTDVGHLIPVHQGAPGKVLLAFRPAELREEVLARPLQAATPRTIVDPDELREELRRVAEAGYALSIEERTPMTSTIAVPILDHTGKAIAAMSISGPSSRLSRERLLELAPSIREAAESLSGTLGYRSVASDGGRPEASTRPGTA